MPNKEAEEARKSVRVGGKERGDRRGGERQRVEGDVRRRVIVRLKWSGHSLSIT